jgi:hypothetical protein
MAFEKKSLKRDANDDHIPQYYNPTLDDYEVQTGANGAPNVQLVGSLVAEQKTQADAVAGTVTFTNNVLHLEIYNVDATNQGIFNVNGINITVPAGEVFKASYGGTPRATVTVTGSTSYILTRYE